MTATLRRSVSVLASLTFLGFALTTATGCGAASASVVKVASPSDLAAPADATDATEATNATAVASTTISPAADKDPGVLAKKEEITGLEALVDQEKQALAAKGLTTDDRAEHQSTLGKLVKMKADSEAELAVLEKPFAVAVAAPSAKVALTSARVPAPPKLPGVPGVGLPATVPGIAALPATPAIGNVAALGSSPKGAAMGLAKLGASRIPGGGAALGAASALAGAGSNPKGAALGLAKLGASHIPGGGAVLGSASAAANVAADPKGAAKDLAKQGATAALNKVPVPAALKSSLFGGLTK